MSRLLMVSMIAAIAIEPSLYASAGGQAERKEESATREKESKKKASKNLKEPVSLVIARPDRAFFQLKKKKVGPFVFKGVRGIDSGKIYATKETADGSVAVGVLHKEKENKDLLFAIRSDEKGEKSELLFSYQLEDIEPRTGLVAIHNDTIDVAAVTKGGQGITSFKVNFAGKDVGKSSGEELGRPEYEGMKVEKILSLVNDKITYQLNNGEKRATSFVVLPLPGEIPSSVYKALE